MNLKLLLILAQLAEPRKVTPDDLKQGVSGLSRLRGTDLLVVIAVSLLLLIALVAWAVFIRKPKNEHARTRVYKHRPREEETDDGMIRKRKRHKRPRREHRQRNPTLSEAGGLPPVKSDGGPPLL
jgi:hypothetical protein